MRKGLVIVVALALLVGGGAYGYDRHRAAQQAADRAASRSVAARFLAAWQAKRYDVMGTLTASDPDAGDSYALLASRLEVSSLTITPGAFSADGRRLSYHVTAVLKGLGDLAWDNTVETTKTSHGFRVQFRSSSVFPGLTNGLVLSRSDPIASRGELVDRHGTPIRGNDADLTANVLGSLKADKTGLERVYDSQLTGSSGGTIQIVERGTGTVSSVVKTFPPKRAKAVTTTLDLPMQRAAEAALARVNGQAAMVVIDTATSEIRAVADRPVAGLPAAFSSEAPGSTFKIVVAAAALQHGFTPSTTVKCPASVVFGGKRFVNDETLPAAMTFATAFARSCNTAFLNVANTFPKGTLRALAPSFGFDRGAMLPTGAEGGTIPPPASTTEAYADVIGQGRVEASPLLMASVAAAVASGSWHRPHLVVGTSDATNLPASVLPALRQLMAGVVTSGTAAAAGLPAGTRGKTGTAQYGTGNPLPVHAWFVGYRGSLAFCVYVKDGDTGGRTAAPVAAAFLRSFGG